MRALQLVIIAALSIAVPITVEAQYTTGQQTTTTATSTNDTTQSPENQWGFKADLQYFRTAGQYQTSASQTLVTTGGITTAGTTTSGITTPGGSTTPPTTGPYVARDTTTSSSSPSGLSDAVLSGLHLWRADIGVALRW